MPIFVFMYIGQGLHPATHHAEIPSMTFHSVDRKSVV